MERYFRFERIVRRILEQIAAELRGGSGGAADVARGSIERRRAGISAAVERAREDGIRPGRLCVARDQRGQPVADRVGCAAAKGDGVAPVDGAEDELDYALRVGLTMKGFFGKHKWFLAVLGLVAVLIVWWLAAPLRGSLSARIDVAWGHYRLLTYGLPVAWLPEYAVLLKERYGVEVHAVAGCVVSQSLISYVDNYNRVSTAAANRRFGHDVFKECEEDVSKRRDRAKVGTEKTP